MRTAIFPGSFNPFTIGHADIVARGLRLFDRVVIGVGYNVRKDDAACGAAKRAARIAALYAGEPRVSVEAYPQLTTEFAKTRGAGFILRGVREVSDFEYERRLADMNSDISDIETVILTANPALAHVSSSAVRELAAFGYDVSRFLPAGLVWPEPQQL